MRKRDELADPRSCLNRAEEGEWLFVLLERDRALPAALRAWAAERVKLGLNRPDDEQVLEPLRVAALLAAAAQAGGAAMPDEPSALAPHAGDYREGAWREYTPAELGWWVLLLLKRADMRADPAKRAKDLHDARNYLAMLSAHVDAAGGAP